MTPRTFERQIGWLARHGYQTVTLDALLAARTGARLPYRPVAITFDDGFAEATRYAADTLSRHRFTATFFLVAGMMGKESRWTARHRAAFPIVDWREARRLLSAGFCVGSHTVTHPRLAELAPEEATRELADSRREIEDRLGEPVRHFAYPFGSRSPAVRDLVAAAGYASAVTSSRGLAQVLTDDPLAWPREEIDGEGRFLDFVCQVRTGANAERFAQRYRRPAIGRTARLIHQLTALF